MKYLVQCSETVFYDLYVDADNEDMARDMVLDGQVDIGEPVDGKDFDVDFVTPMACDIERFVTGEDTAQYVCRSHDELLDKPDATLCSGYVEI